MHLYYLWPLRNIRDHWKTSCVPFKHDVLGSTLTQKKSTKVSYSQLLHVSVIRMIVFLSGFLFSAFYHRKNTWCKLKLVTVIREDYILGKTQLWAVLCCYYSSSRHFWDLSHYHHIEPIGSQMDLQHSIVKKIQEWLVNHFYSTYKKVFKNRPN